MVDGYEIARALVGKTIEYADVSGDITIRFTDGTVLELEARDSGPDEWGHHASAKVEATLRKV